MAVLGPTNTGKTHLALERMLGHSSAMIGLPLRLLAREVYDRVAGRAGKAAVALITGEEKIVPRNPRYFICTTEAMPLQRDVAFLAIDEVQLCGDGARGHIFTDRLLRARGREETMLLGADTIRPALRALLPDIETSARTRFSRLSFSGPRKLSRLPKRSAVIAFSAGEIYALAERIRRHKGGAAVIMGALSPRTRNAQVALYQSGEVDYLVATDAIGMGLNMDIDHVAFASLSKFDGNRRRRLRAAELAQIAGRAGRHMNDGTFGTLDGRDGCPALDAGVIGAIENHRFAPLESLQWRNAALDYSSPSALLHSLEKAPPHPLLQRAGDGEDLETLRSVAAMDSIRATARGPAATALLWEVCRLPDYRKTLHDHHAALVARLYGLLMAHDGQLPGDWLARQITHVERTDGDIDSLANRIAHIRTWTYVANRPGWTADAAHWQARARAVEDRLSDALHARLLQRFVDRRGTVLMRGRANPESSAAVDDSGDVTLDGEYIGRLSGLRFSPDAEAPAAERGRLVNAASKALRHAVARRIARLNDPSVGKKDSGGLSLRLADSGRAVHLCHAGGAIARLEKGADILHPRIVLLANPLLGAGLGRQLQDQAETWLDRRLKHTLGPLLALQAELAPASAVLSGAARGLVYQLVEGLGTAARDSAGPQLKALGRGGRAGLRKRGITFGVKAAWCPAVQGRRALQLRYKLWLVWHGAAAGGISPAAAIGRPAIDPDPAFRDPPWGFGYAACGPLLVRIDLLETLDHRARRLITAAQKADIPALARPFSGDRGQLLAALSALGYGLRAGSGRLFRCRRR